MSIGYMGYVKLGGTIYPATGSSIAESISPIYSSSARGAGWLNSGVAYSADDVHRYEGNVDFELVTGMWTSLKNWIITTRTTPAALIVSPDGATVYTFSAIVAGGIAGAYCSSANFSTSEGSFVTCSIGVLGVSGYAESTGTGYIANSAGQTFIAYSPLPYWGSTVSIGGTAYTTTTIAIDWSVDITNNPVVVYGCTGSVGPIALMMGEAEATANVVLFNASGVAALAKTAQAVAISTGGGTLTLPSALAESDGNDLSGGSSIISRAYSFKGLATSNNSPITM